MSTFAQSVRGSDFKYLHDLLNGRESGLSGLHRNHRCARLHDVAMVHHYAVLLMVSGAIRALSEGSS